MLEIRDLQVHFDGIHAIKGISLNVPKGEIVTLIGANGAGKTTTLRAISGLKRPTSGKFFINKQEITHRSTRARVKLGISQVPEGRHVFPNMSVQENLEMGAFLRKGNLNTDLDLVFSAFPRLKNRYKQLAGTLSGGEQQMLAMGRAMLSKPKVLLLDEPSMGLAPLLVQEIFEIIININKMGTTILLVEQNANMALQIAHQAYVMETGTIVLSGKATDLANSENIKRAYLGG